MTCAASRVLPGAVLGLASLASLPLSALEPANFSAGPVLVTPTLETQVGYIDNLLRSRDNEKDTGFSLIKPQVQAWIEDGINTYSLTYELADYRYFDSSDDDYTDHAVSFDLYYDFNARNRLNAYAQYYWIHEERGVGFTEGFIAELVDEPVEVERGVLGGDYTLGSESSRGRLNIALEAVDHDFFNLEELTFYRNRDSYTADGTFYWRVAERTDALLEVRYIETTYDRTDPSDVAGSLDSEEYIYYAGLSWKATAKTVGSVKLGYYDRSYDSDDRDTDEGFSWEVDLVYKPRTYSRITLETRRYFEETNGLGDGVNTEKTELGWEHDWSSRSNTQLIFMIGEEDYTASPREDDRWGVEASYNYAFRRWVDLGIGYRYEDRDSDLRTFDYNRNEVFLEVRLSL